MLDDISQCARSKSSLDEIRISMRCQEDDFCKGTGFFQSIGCLYSVEFWHRNVSDDQVGLQFHSYFDQRFAVLHAPDDVECWFQ